MKTGKQSFSRSVGKEFFESFDNSEVLDASLHVEVTAFKSGSSIDIDMSLRGSLTVECDRCLEDLQMPVAQDVRLCVSFTRDDGETQTKGEGDEREILAVSPDDDAIDLDQTVYDYAMLALPLQRVHKDGECNPAALRYLGKPSEEVNSGNDSGENNPFAALKGLFDK
ncbi:MAG: DUF177 domain-containing protein [Bacteroidales bacterium]|nr:DUF177 domain-containing protein [Bacteroidales bacterium]